jgi:hypothetical protein
MGHDGGDDQPAGEAVDDAHHRGDYDFWRRKSSRT